jgi:hypothetical protein
MGMQRTLDRTTCEMEKAVTVRGVVSMPLRAYVY